MTDSIYQLAMSVTGADGRIRRWGPDELSSDSVPSGLTFSTSIPGGFKDMNCTLLRELNAEYPDQALFDSVKVYGAGGKTAWEGRMVQFPREQSDTFAVRPGAVGWSAHLKDDTSFREIYIDRDLSHWKEAPLPRQLANNASVNTFGGGVASDSTGMPALLVTIRGAWGRSSSAEQWYDSEGIPIGVLRGAWKINSQINPGDGNWSWFLFTGTDMVASGLTSTANLRAAGPGTTTLTPTNSPTFAATQLFYGPASGTAGVDYSLIWTQLGIYGRHGLTARGNLSATEVPGFYASDIVADIVKRTAPLLTYTTGAEGSITPTTFIVPQAAFLDPTTGDDAISDLNKYHLYEWGVYDNREFFWRPPNSPGTTNWTARLSAGAQVSLEGDDANNIFNGVFVTYQDANGKRHTAGPPGSGAESTDASLQDTSDTNPVNAHKIPRRWGRLDISQTTTQAGAIQVGAVWLAEHNAPARRGQITLTGTVDHPTKGSRPVWEVRAGDTITIAERQGDVSRRIIETSYDHDSRKLTGSMDNTVFKLDAIMERMGIGLVGVI